MILSFDGFVVDTELYELRAEDGVVALEPLVFSLLVFLAQNAGRVVSKDEIIGAVWQGRAVSDTTLSSRIFALRKVLGDSGSAQSVIRTIPRRGFRFLPAVEVVDRDVAAVADSPRPAALHPAPAQPAALQPILVVLPFRSASSDLDPFFCDGLTEDVISNLTHFSEIRVIASATSFRFKDRDLGFAEIAAEVGANYIIAGSVRREADRLRVAVELIDAASNVSLWADRYDRELSDIFAVQDAMTRMIVAALGVHVQGAELKRALRKSPSDLDAYECLLHARRYTATLDDAMHFQARELLEQAVRIDPAYAEAHALLANVYLAEYRFDANPRPDPIGRALAASLRATELDPQSAYAHCWLGITHFFRKDLAKFEAELQRALDLNPNDPEILAEAGHYLSFMGQYDRGIGFSKRARQLNPLHPGWYHFAPARLHFRQRRFEEALEDVQRISMPSFFWARMLQTAILGQLDDPRAPAALARMVETRPDLPAEDIVQKWNTPAEDAALIFEGLRRAGY